MKQSLNKGLEDEQKKELKGEFLSSRLLRKQLIQLLEDKIKSSQQSSRSKDEYSNPNWAYLQADSRGYERALHEVISLLS